MPLLLHVLDDEGESRSVDTVLFAPFMNKVGDYLVMYPTEGQPARVYEAGDRAWVAGGTLVVNPSILQTFTAVELDGSMVLDCELDEVAVKVLMENSAYPDACKLACPGCGELIPVHRIATHCFNEHPSHLVRETPYESYTELIAALRELLRELAIDHEEIGWLERCVEGLQEVLDLAHDGYERSVGN